LWDDIHRMTADAGAAAKVRFLVREVEERYRNSSSLAAVKLILAQVEWRLGNEKRAQEIAREVENLFPRSEHARTARSFEKSFARPYQSVMPLGGGDRSKRKQVVVLDPGHGGEDRGAVGPRGRTEKEVVLLIAKRAAALIEQRGNFSVFLTRESDVALPLSERTRLANERGAVLFVSLHTNASTDHRPRGLATYYLDNADDAASRALAERENALVSLAGNREDSDLALMLSSLVQASKMEDSVVLAHSVHQSINRSVRAPNRWQGSGLRDLGVKKAPFFVLVGAHMPCVLLELFFIDNRDDAALLAEEQFREMIARGIADGIEDFSRATSHTQ
jgi:N-acetylmuramoyl-L-alanine amidase